ncbi:MAG: ATP phosphoribosyltransferase [Proteobacteria bacterium]|nr:ATP phosphoribosyltransferase [Pseudomonadota bacterium]
MPARPIIVALPKGRILDDSAKIFARAGYDLSPAFAESRKLVFECGPLRILVLRNSDIVTYVSHGAADVGVVGSDVLDEEGADLYEPLDLGIGRCQMIVAERVDATVDPQAHLRIATKYPRTTKAYLVRRGITAEVIKLSGAQARRSHRGLDRRNRPRALTLEGAFGNKSPSNRVCCRPFRVV